MKYKKVLIMVLSVCFILCSCHNANNNSGNENADESVAKAETTVSTSEHTQKAVSENDSITSSTSDSRSYTISEDTVSASELYDCSTYTINKINGSEFTIINVIDESNMLVELFLSGGEAVEGNNQIGSYNIKDKTYKEIVSVPAKYSVLSNTDKYIVFMSVDDVMSLYCYNIQLGQMQMVYNFVDTQPTSDEPVIKDDMIYFDTYVSDGSKTNSILYEYSIKDSELNVCQENAQKPMIKDGSLVAFVYDENEKTYNTLQTISETDNKFNFEVMDEISDICCNDSSVYALTVQADGRGTGISDLNENIDILSTIPENGDMLSELDANRYFVKWNDYCGIEQIPSLYDIEQNKIVIFDDMPECYYYEHILNNFGIIYSFDSSGAVNLCSFKKK